MKKLLVTLAVAITGVVQAFALTPTAIRENARFLTDRMAYELNLTPQQIEDCYEINYDFIASINPIMDEVVYGYPEYIDRYYNYLDYRNDDLRYIMTEAQYLAFISLDYFFRPVYTYAGNWLFRIFDIYTNHRFFYYDAPLIYHSYYGGHGRHYVITSPTATMVEVAIITTCMHILVPSIAEAVVTTSVLTPHVLVHTQRLVTLLLPQGTREWIMAAMTTTVATTMASTIVTEAMTTIAAILAVARTKAAAMAAAMTTAIVTEVSTAEAATIAVRTPSRATAVARCASRQAADLSASRAA